MKISSINPSTGKLIKTIECTSPSELTKIITASHIAQEAWAVTSASDRKKLFENLKIQLTKHFKDFVSLIQSETGKMVPDIEAELFDTPAAIDLFFREYEKVADQNPEGLDSSVFPDTTATLKYYPQGLVAAIMPWNFPFMSPMSYILPALIAGNSVVFKPSEYSTLIGLKIKELFDQSSFPKDLVQVVVGDETIGKLLVKSDVDKIFMVGSARAGEDIIRHAGIKSVQVELGGNSAAIVLADADLELAAQAIVWGATYNAGQDCVGIKRVYVVKKVADKFIQLCVGKVKELRPGRDYGPVITSSSVDLIYKRIRSAIKLGAKLLIGGEKFPGFNSKTQNGYWISPSVLTGVPDNAGLVAQETFGNVLPICVVKDVDTAIEKSNNTQFGLSTVIFTKDKEKIKSLTDQAQSGLVFINDSVLNLPGVEYWGGWKKSGIPNTESKIMQCLKKKLIFLNNSGQPRAFWYPYPDK